jgi:short-subunit dehydrogenase
VTCLCPGPVATEFQARAGVPDAEVSWPLAVAARRVAEAGYRGLMQGRRLVVPGFANKAVVFLASRLAPRPIMLAAVDARQSRRRSPPAATA